MLSTQPLDHANPSATTSLTTHQSQSAITPHPIQRTDAPLRVQKAFKKGRKKEKEWDTDRYSHWYRMNVLILMQVLFGCIANNNSQQNLHHSKDDDDALQTMYCHHVQWRMYLFSCFYLCIHTQANNNTTHRQRQQRSRLCYDERIWWKEAERMK